MRLKFDNANFGENSNLSRSRSSTVIDLGADRKRICNFLLVVNSNFRHISYRFQYTDALIYFLDNLFLVFIFDRI